MRAYVINISVYLGVSVFLLIVGGKIIMPQSFILLMTVYCHSLQEIVLIEVAIFR